MNKGPYFNYVTQTAKSLGGPALSVRFKSVRTTLGLLSSPLLDTLFHIKGLWMNKGLYFNYVTQTTKSLGGPG